MKTSLLTAPLFVLSFLQAAHGQWVTDPAVEAKIQEGIDHIYNLEFYDADKQFDQAIAVIPDHPAGHFFKAMTQWWRILTTVDDESQDSRFIEMLEKVIEMCNERLQKDPKDVTALFFKGGSLGFRGRLRANRGDWFAAAKDGLAALPIVQKAFGLDPQNSDILLGIGIYNYYAEVIPREYPVVKPFMLFVPDGDKEKGLQQLTVAAESSKYAKTEAKYFLMQNYFLYEKNISKALELAQILNKRYPRNSVFHRAVGRCQVSLGNWQEAKRVFSEVEKRFRQGQPGYEKADGREACYYLGKYAFTFNNLPEALAYFLKCDELSRAVDKDGPSGFMSMANLHMGMIYDLQKKRHEALKQYGKVLKMKEYESTHKDAQKYIDDPYGSKP